MKSHSPFQRLVFGHRPVAQFWPVICEGNTPLERFWEWLLHFWNYEWRTEVSLLFADIIMPKCDLWNFSKRPVIKQGRQSSDKMHGGRKSQENLREVEPEPCATPGPAPHLLSGNEFPYLKKSHLESFPHSWKRSYADTIPSSRRVAGTRKLLRKRLPT